MRGSWKTNGAREMCAIRDAIFYCERCTAENFYDLDRARQKQPVNPCWGCGRALETPPRMRLGGEHDAHLVVLSRGAQLFPHHLERDTYNFSRPLAEVTANPFGMRNLSNNWICREQEDSIAVVRQDDVLLLRTDCHISFGKIEAQVRLR